LRIGRYHNLFADKAMRGGMEEIFLSFGIALFVQTEEGEMVEAAGLEPAPSTIVLRSQLQHAAN
jgi:hypothetical protein